MNDNTLPVSSAVPVLTGWEGSFNPYEESFRIMNNLYSFQDLSQEIVLTGVDFLAKVRMDGFIKGLAWF